VAALATTLMTGMAHAASHVYVSAWNAARIDELVAHPNGTLASFGSVPVGAFEPWYMAMTSNAKNLYVATFSSEKLEAFSVAANGALTHKTALHGGSLPTGKKPGVVAVSPDNRNAYVANYNGASLSTISIYDLAADGSVKVHSPAGVSGGAGPYGVAVSRDGKSVYAADQDGSIYQFNRATNGSLTPKSPASVAVKQISDSPTPDYVVLTPDGRHLYSANYNDSSVGIFDVAANGTLTEKPSSPVLGGYGFYVIAMSADGRSLYGASNTDGRVYQYSVLPNGYLNAKSPASVVAGVSLDGIWLSPNGKSAYVANAGTYMTGGNYQGYNVSQFTLDASGRLLPKSPPTVATDSYPAAIVVAPDRSPKASFTFSTATGLTKRFDATASKDPDGTVTRYRWTFGDGTGPIVGGPKPTHKYAHAGTYNVTLTVIDNARCSVAKVWTGQTAYCSGNPGATVLHKVTVKS
jgi:DNA-binding beta-propeller fold protein YncE